MKVDAVVPEIVGNRVQEAVRLAVQEIAEEVAVAREAETSVSIAS